MIGIRVEYQAGWGCSGIGIVTAVNEKTGMITVKDDEDGSVWYGSPEHVEIWDEEAI